MLCKTVRPESEGRQSLASSMTPIIGEEDMTSRLKHAGKGDSHSRDTTYILRSNDDWVSFILRTSNVIECRYSEGVLIRWASMASLSAGDVGYSPAARCRFEREECNGFRCWVICQWSGSKSRERCARPIDRGCRREKEQGSLLEATTFAGGRNW